MSEPVFAYGSNMCSGRFRAYGVSPEGRGRAAVLADYRLRFNKRSTLDNSGKANIEIHAGSVVWGVLYTIPDDQLGILDRGEGGYRRVCLRVSTAENSPVDAWVYIAIRPDNRPLRPYSWYKRFIVSGAREHALPASYVAELENIEDDPDPNQNRDREKRALPCEMQG